MQLLVEVSNHLPDAAQCTPQQFLHEAKLAMAIKLFEMKGLSSGMAALLIGMTRMQFLDELFYFHFDKTSIIQGQLVIDLITSGVFSIASKPITKSSSSASMEAKTLL